MVKNYKEWSKLFPKNKAILYCASEGKKGELACITMSKGFLKSGFFVFRNSWGNGRNSDGCKGWSESILALPTR